MRTLWISILGFSSGRTAIVVTDGRDPYLPGTVTPASAEQDIIDRYTKAGQRQIITLAKKADRIMLLPYSKDVSQAKQTTVQALTDAHETCDEPDWLAMMMPEDDENS